MRRFCRSEERVSFEEIEDEYEGRVRVRAHHLRTKRKSPSSFPDGDTEH
jgi:hypothetical protein